MTTIVSQLYGLLQDGKCYGKEKARMWALGIWSVQVAILNRGGEGVWGPHWEEDIGAGTETWKGEVGSLWRALALCLHLIPTATLSHYCPCACSVAEKTKPRRGAQPPGARG